MSGSRMNVRRTQTKAKNSLKRNKAASRRIRGGSPRGGKKRFKTMTKDAILAEDATTMSQVFVQSKSLNEEETKLLREELKKEIEIILQQSDWDAEDLFMFLHSIDYDIPSFWDTFKTFSLAKDEQKSKSNDNSTDKDKEKSKSNDDDDLSDDNNSKKEMCDNNNKHKRKSNSKKEMFDNDLSDDDDLNLYDD